MIMRSTIINTINTNVCTSGATYKTSYNLEVIGGLATYMTNSLCGGVFRVETHAFSLYYVCNIMYVCIYACT